MVISCSLTKCRAPLDFSIFYIVNRSKNDNLVLKILSKKSKKVASDVLMMCSRAHESGQKLPSRGIGSVASDDQGVSGA